LRRGQVGRGVTELKAPDVRRRLKASLTCRQLNAVGRDGVDEQLRHRVAGLAKATTQRPSGLANSALSNGTCRPSPTPKKSPMGAATAGCFAPSQYISRRTKRRCSSLRGMVPLSQMRWMIPAPALHKHSSLTKQAV
jgi:hypothetical protein